MATKTEVSVKFTKEGCLANLKLVGQKIQRCDWVLQNSENEEVKAQALRSLKKLRPVHEALEEAMEEFDG